MALNSRWIRKQVPVEVEVTRITIREVSYIAVDKSFSGSVPQWMFLQDFQPVPERKKRGVDPSRVTHCYKLMALQLLKGRYDDESTKLHKK